MNHVSPFLLVAVATLLVVALGTLSRLRFRQRRPSTLQSTVQLPTAQPHDHPSSTPQLAPQPRRLPYALRLALLTPAERSFYHALVQAVGTHWVICPQVRMADVLMLPSGTSERQTHFNRIAAKHLDFVLADPRSFAPVLGIELDDRSHRRSDRGERDAFINRACADAGLPLLRITAARTYPVTEIAARIQQTVERRNAA